MNKKQDANGVRSASDLERKYDFAALLGLKKNVKLQLETLTKINNELNSFINATTSNMASLQDQVDGKISTWFFNGIPTLNNLPASEWEQTELEAHIGDLYYDKQTGYCYRFDISSSVYSWTRIKDSEISTAMSIASAAQDTADNKRQIFVVQPIPPYSCGDLWITSNEIYICQVERRTGNFDSSDWINNLKYTDNTYARAIVDELGGTITQVLNGTVTQYSDSWVKYTDLATGGSTTINGSNITTGNINTDNVSIGNGNVLIDKTGIILNNGAKVIGNNGLLNTYLFSNNRFENCGYYIDPIVTGVSEVEKISIDVVIPDGLTITSAFIKIIHVPTLWGYNSSLGTTSTQWGYCRNLKAYKRTGMMSRKIYKEMASETITEDTTIFDEIIGVFGSNGWTATPSSEASHNTEIFTSEDISSIFNNQEDLYQIMIKPNDDINQSWGAREGCERSGCIYAMLIVNGYMSYS